MAQNRSRDTKEAAPTLPPYTIRESPRARRARIWVKESGVEIVIPPGFDRTVIPRLMAERKLWIENALARLQAEASSRPVPSAIKLPESIHLLAVDETWPVVYEQVSRGENPIASWPDGKLVIRCDLKDHDTIRTFLRRWLELRAGVLLPPVLQQVSQAAGLTCGKVTIRTQRTRWASCSSQNDISVNAHLLFFPPELVRYVFLHELCHTIHRNHSRDFYGLLAEKEPKSETYRRRMREAGKCIPDWARK